MEAAVRRAMIVFLGLALSGVARGQAVTATPITTASPTPSPTAAPCERIRLGPPTLPAGSVGVAYNQAIGATPLRIYNWSGASLPPGLFLSHTSNQLSYNSGILSGRPTTAGTFTFTVTAAYGVCTGSISYTLLVGPAPTPTVTSTVTPTPTAFPKVHPLRTPRVVPFRPPIT
jgi:hypothetical protein